MAASLCDVALTGIWNVDIEGNHYVDLDITLHVTSKPNTVLPVLDIGPNTSVNILGQDVFKLKHNPSRNLDTASDTQLYDDKEAEDGTYPVEEIGEPYDDVSIDTEVTSRKLVTRDMRISPSPIKQRLFPPSPDTDEEDENSDNDVVNDEDNSSGSSSEVRGIGHGDNDIFGISKTDDVESRRQNIADNAREPSTITRGLQPRGSLPDFGHSQQDSMGFDVETEDKENEVPKGEVGHERVCSRVPLGEIAPKRNSTTDLILGLPPSNEEPNTVNHGNPAPLPQFSNDFLTVSKRASRSSPQKGSVSRIPVKKIYKDESAGSDHGPVSIVGPQDDTGSPQFAHKRNSPIARMAIMARALSNPSPPGVDSDNEPREGDTDTLVADEPPTCWSASQSSGTCTPTKLRLHENSSGYGLDDVLDTYEDSTSLTEEPDTKSEAIQPVDESEGSGDLISFDHESKDEDSGDDKLLESPKDEMCHTPESGNFDIDELYGSADDFCGSESSIIDEEGLYEGQNKNIDLPSPSTASQQSMKWYYPGDMAATCLGEYPTLEMAEDMLTLRMTSNVVPANLAVVATIRVTLTGSLENDSEEFKASLSDTDGHISIPWEVKYKPPQVNGWALKLSMMLPFSVADEEDDSYMTEYQPLKGEEELEKEEEPETELKPDSEPETEQGASVEDTDPGYCPCCSYHRENSPLVNTGRLMAMAGGVSHKLSIGSQVAQTLLHDLRPYFDLSKPCGKAGRVFRAMLRNLCGEEGPFRFILNCIRLALLVGIVSFVTGIGFRAASWSPYSWQKMVVGSQHGVICPAPEKIDPSVCCGMDLSLCPGATGGSLGQSVDIAGKEVADEMSTLSATWAVPPMDCGERGQAGGATATSPESSENGSSTTTGTAPTRALPGADGDGDGPASGLDGVDAADEGGNIGSGKADKANNARKASFRDRVDWALGWRGPLFD